MDTTNTEEEEEEVIDDSSVDSSLYAPEVDETEDSTEDSTEDTQDTLSSEEGTGDVDSAAPDPSKVAKDNTLRIDEESLVKLAKAVQAGPAPQQSDQPAPLSTEEIEKIFRPVRITKEKLRAMGYEDPTDEQVKGFQAILEETAQHSVAIAQVMVQRAESQVRRDLTPLQQAYLDVQYRQSEETFYSKHPELRDYKQFVQIAARNVQGEGKNVDQIISEVATLTKGMLTQVNPGLKFVANPGSPATKPATGTPKPAALGGSGRSPSPGVGKGAEKFNPDTNIYT